MLKIPEFDIDIQYYFYTIIPLCIVQCSKQRHHHSLFAEPLDFILKELPVCKARF